MFDGIRAFLQQRLLKRLIVRATEALYSEDSDLDAIIGRLSRNKGGIALLRAYIAIQTAARLAEPLTKGDVDHALHALIASEQHLDSPDSEALLDVHRDLAEISWQTKVVRILRGKLAHKENEYSYEGTIYSFERIKRGPISSQERRECTNRCRELAELDRELNHAELRALAESDPEALQRRTEESELEERRREMDRREAKAFDLETQELLSMYEKKLQQLLQGSQHRSLARNGHGQLRSAEDRVQRSPSGNNENAGVESFDLELQSTFGCCHEEVPKERATSSDINELQQKRIPDEWQ